MNQRFKLHVSDVVLETDDVRRYVLTAPDGRPLEPFRAGAHLDLHLEENLIRQYSLCSDPSDRSAYELAVLRENEGRGGSIKLHREFRPGTLVEVSGPKNHFPLAEDAESHLLLAGGIGITPLIAMVHELERRNLPFRLHFCTRSPSKTPFMSFLNPFIERGHVVLHHDGGEPSKGLDIPELLSSYESGTHLYYCGPAGFMKAAENASAHWPKEAVHFEHFSAAPDPDPPAISASGFEVKIASSGQIFHVPPDKSIVTVLREHGVEVQTSCEDGVCGTCMTRFLEGEVEHRDMVLDEEEQQEHMMICCSRAKSPLLILDL